MSKVRVGIIGSQFVADLHAEALLCVLETICAACASARTGQRVSLPFEGARRARKPIDLWRRE